MAIIPNGFALCSASFECVGLTRRPVITMGVRYNTHPVASFINTVWRESLSQSGSNCPFEPANMSPSWSLVETKVLANVGSVLFSDVNATVVAGSEIALLNVPTPNVSVVIAKQTALAGRQYRGRLFSPPSGVNEADVTNAGLIDTAQVTALQILWTHVRTNLISNDLDPVILHEPPLSGGTPVPTDITLLKVTQLVGTNRRRIR